jgi:hypothetical protein
LIALLVILGSAAALRLAGHSPARIRQVSAGIALLLFGWLAESMVTGWLGVYRASVDREFPVIALAIVLPVVVGVGLLRYSEATRQILAAVPQSWLVGLQCYRGLGAIFLVLYGVGRIPGAFALPAGIGDVLVGLSALLVAALHAGGAPGRNRYVAAWNILGLADLLVAVATGFLSAPTRFQMLAQDAPNTLVGLYPLVLIPIYAVPLSIVLHVASLLKLARPEQP